jgi:hypothetical protein
MSKEDGTHQAGRDLHAHHDTGYIAPRYDAIPSADPHYCGGLPFQFPLVHSFAEA